MLAYGGEKMEITDAYNITRGLMEPINDREAEDRQEEYEAKRGVEIENMRLLAKDKPYEWANDYVADPSFVLGQILDLSLNLYPKGISLTDGILGAKVREIIDNLIEGVVE